METTRCNLCDGSLFSELYTVPDYLFHRADVITHLVRCDECGLIYQNPRPTLEEMNTHYPPAYECYNPEPDREINSRLLERAINYGIHKRCRIVTRHKSNGVLLDIGCSTGVFLRGMQKYYPTWQLFGLEVNQQSAMIASQNYHLNVFHGTLEQANYSDASFDAVTLWDVLEHLHNPSDSLKEIHRILKSDGIVVLRIPNGDSRDAKSFGHYWAGLEPPRHLYIFGIKTITELLHKNGFSIIEMSCSSGAYPTFILSLRFWLTGKNFGSDKVEQIARILNHPMSRLVAAPFFFLRSIGLKGPLLTIVANKNIIRTSKL